MKDILLLAAMATMIPGLVLHLMVRRHRTALGRSVPWYSKVHWCWWCWWVEKPKVETLLTPRGVTLSRAAGILIYIGVIAYGINLWIL